MKPERLPWDSDFFGFTVSALRIESQSVDNLAIEIKSAYQAGTKLLYLFNPNPLNNENILKQFNGLLVDKKVVFAKKLDKINSLPQDNIAEYTKDFVTDELKDLAYQSGEYSRFKLDTRLPKDTFQKLYSIWIENSINGKFASKTFTYNIRDSIAGFITVAIKNDYGDIGLIAVNSKYRGMEIGSKLMRHTENFVLHQGKIILKVATQIDNEGACNFYKKNGYDIDSMTYIYHFMNLKV